MRQAATAVTVCLCIAVAAPARGGDGAGVSAAGTIGRARRLIDARDYASATKLLEDLLLDSGAEERPVILGILKQAYEVMATQAEAAGRDREAAHYRDNLAILSARTPTRVPARASSTRAKGREAPRSPAPTPDETDRKPGDRTQPPAPKSSNPTPSTSVSGPALEEPAALSEPPVMLEPGSAAARAGVPNANRPSEAFSGQETDTPQRNITRTDPADTPGRPFAAAAPGPAAARDAATASGTPKGQPGGGTRTPEGPSPSEADRLFSAKQYKEAGQCYAALARENRLPTNRTNHWAYCRIVGVATRMNARPKSAREWDEIEAEIKSIQRLAPNLWYGEYLRDRLADVRKGRSRTKAQSDNFVVRGSAPDEGPEQTRRFPRLFGKSRASAPSKADGGAAAAAAPNEPDTQGAQRPLALAGDRSQGQSSPAEPEGALFGNATAKAASGAAGPSAGSNEAEPADASAPANRSGQWQVRETRNFRIFHADSRLADKAAESAESVRAAQAKRWGTSALQRAWSPRCEVYLYPDGKAFAAATGQPESSPGFSTMESNGQQITTRKVILRADHPQILAAILPHEVTHVVVADLFTAQQIPRWADEGIAVLAEPETEQNLRAADLRESLSSGHVFDLRQLMSIDTPEPKDWSLYYAQSVSLTRFLVEQGTPEQLVQFVRESGGKGIEVALRDIYHIVGFAELQERWQGYARERLASAK